MRILKSLGRKSASWIGLLIVGILTGCGGGYGYYGEAGATYYAPGSYYEDPAYYGGFWGAGVYGYPRGRVDHDWGRRGSESRSAGGFHGGGAPRGGVSHDRDHR